ncbi:glycosyltransferase [Sulfurimonas sp.]
MKVAIVVRSLKIGGMERVAISLTKAFQDAGHESHLIYFKHKKKHYSTEGISNVHFWNFDKFLLKTGIGFLYEIFIRLLNIPFRQSYAITKGFITSPIFKYKLKKLEKNSKKFDLIIIRGQGTFEFLWLKQDKRYVQVCENLLYPDHKMTYFRKQHAKILYGNKNIACVSEGVLQSFKSLEKEANLRAKKALKITNPIDVKSIQEAAKEYQPNITVPYIVNVGRLAPVKQLPLLIDAYAYIKEKYNVTHKLVLVGQGHDEENIRNKIETLNLQNDVIMTGLQTNPYPWIANAKLFVLSSKHEGLGMVILEALACQTNIVVTKSPGGVSDIMQNELEEFLCEGTVESLGEKIYLELSNPSYIDFNKHLHSFLPNTIVNQYLKEFL